MRIDPKKVVLKPNIYKIAMNSGLNPYEITRIVKDIEQSGITENEKYDKEIQKTVKDSTSNKCAHVVYIWSKDRDEEDVLNIKFIKKK